MMKPKPPKRDTSNHFFWEGPFPNLGMAISLRLRYSLILWTCSSLWRDLGFNLFDFFFALKIKILSLVFLKSDYSET